MFSYDKDTKALITFRNKATFWLGGSRYFERSWPEPVYDGGILCDNTTIIALTKSKKCLLIDRYSWKTIAESNILFSNESDVSILDIHRNLPLIAFLVNQTSVRIFRLNLQEQHTPLSASSAAAVTSPSHSSHPEINSTDWLKGDFEDIEGLEKIVIAKGTHSKIYELKRS
ncbi:MAG: hypothetical protein KDK65_00815, partial [Chlamydiia bacterium]|nr:hypothetical protein [Chlamydiia bacterium]